MAAPVGVVGELERALGEIRFEQGSRVRQEVLDLLRTDLVEVRICARRVPEMFGTSELALCLEGTLGMNYQGRTYNIPVELYLAPLRVSYRVFFAVVPTANMLIRANHESVDASGVVHFDYLNNYNQHSNLVELCTIASSIFGAKPPLFSKPPSASKSESRPPAYDAAVTATKATTLSTTLSPKQELTKKLQERLRTFYDEERRAIDLELAAQARLEKAKADVDADAGRDFSSAVDHVQDKSQGLAAWMETHISEQVHFICDDALSRQLLEKLAESNAIEDVLYALDEFLYHGHIDLDTFLRDVRRLSNAQFKLKAHVRKILSVIDPSSSHHHQENDNILGKNKR